MRMVIIDKWKPAMNMVSTLGYVACSDTRYGTHRASAGQFLLSYKCAHPSSYRSYMAYRITPYTAWFMCLALGALSWFRLVFMVPPLKEHNRDTIVTSRRKCS